MQSSDDYRSAYCRLLDDPDFQALSPEAQRLWFFLRFSRECGPTGLFRFYPELTCSRMKITDAQMRPALAELTAKRWAKLEVGYILLRNAMKFEPTFRPSANSKHLVAVHRHVAPLGRLRIAHELLEDMGLRKPIEWESIPSPDHRVPKGYQGGTEGVSEGYREGIDTVSRTSGSTATAPAPAPATAPATATAPEPGATTANPEPEIELPPDDLPENLDPEHVQNPDANANPWHPDDERDFGTPPDVSPAWAAYLEVHMATRTPAPWPRFMPWLNADIKARAAARLQNPVKCEEAHEGEAQHAKAS